MGKPGGTAKKQQDAPRSNRARAVSEMLPVVGGAAFRRFGFVQSSVVSRWKEIVGDRYAGVSCPESIRFPPGRRSGGVLTLVVEGAHAPVMQHVAPVIVERVNRFFGYEAVSRVQFKQGLVQVARANARTSPPSLRNLRAPSGQPEAEIPADVSESLREIADPELRACMEALARGVAASEGQGTGGFTVSIPVVGRIGERKK
ncbi:DUF721 domain-containing protein [Sphingomonas parva]|uniref:DUF721 domain-containing protein n=2 Tax=Sphingomonas parva TaxID=2555898 RepID=A0A4Y8ZML9_9SPHN|nr:DciA family protein [Sphingomonas parva]TFI56512.1 DUF721 domain-containing protein [Sphingomonas parva]